MRMTVALAFSGLICGCSSPGSPTSSAPAERSATIPAKTTSAPAAPPVRDLTDEIPPPVPESQRPETGELESKTGVAPKVQSTPEPRKLTETERIESLIRHVETLEGAVFIRNGEEHDCNAAAKHMRDKWNWKKKDIKTAEDFIRVAATKSSMSGEIYRIRFKDGHEEKCGEYLLKQLGPQSQAP